MSDEIKINRTTLMLAGLLIISIFAFYVFTSSNKSVNPKYDYPVDTGANPSSTPSTNPSPTANPSSGVQDVYIKALNSGTYDKQSVTVKKGLPVRLHFTADPGAGCGRAIVIYELNVRAISQNGQEQVVDFTPQQAGTFEYSCGMRMFQPGKFIVV